MQVISSVQAGRGLAAILVLLYHASEAIFLKGRYFDAVVFGGFFKFGWAGVPLFFVLSGYVISLTHFKDIGQPCQARRFFRKRFIRIYPVYWIVLSCLTAVYHLMPKFGLGYEQLPGPLISSILLVGPDPYRTIVVVAWSLYHEIIFYAAFGLLIARWRAGLGVCAGWLVCILVAILAGSAEGPFSYLLSPLNLLFGFGICTYLMLRDDIIHRPAYFLLGGLAFFLLMGVLEWYSLGPTAVLANLLYGVGSMAALSGAVRLEQTGRLRVPPLLRLLGDASFSIYLTHFPLLAMIAKVCIASGMDRVVPDNLMFVLMSTTVTGCGVLFYFVVELPILALMRGHRPLLLFRRNY